MARPGLTGHRKFRRLSRALGSPLLARGALELLWDSCYEAGEDYVGTAEDIEHLVGWTGEPSMLTRALAEAGLPAGVGFIEQVSSDGNVAYRVHDLWHHAPDYVTKRRKRELDRQEKADPISVRRTAPNGAGKLESLSCQVEIVRTPSPSHSPSPSPLKERSGVSASDIVTLWNQLVTSPIPQVTKLTTDRRAKIDGRLKAFPALETWRTAIIWVNGQSWCRAPGTGEHPNWTATLDWLCKNDGNVQRCLEKASQPVRLSAEWVCDHKPRCRHRAECQIVSMRVAK